MESDFVVVLVMICAKGNQCDFRFNAKEGQR